MVKSREQVDFKLNSIKDYLFFSSSHLHLSFGHLFPLHSSSSCFARPYPKIELDPPQRGSSEPSLLSPQIFQQKCPPLPCIFCLSARAVSSKLLWGKISMRFARRGCRQGRRRRNRGRIKQCSQPLCSQLLSKRWAAPWFKLASSLLKTLATTLLLSPLLSWLIQRYREPCTRSPALAALPRWPLITPQSLEMNSKSPPHACICDCHTKIPVNNSMVTWFLSAFTSCVMRLMLLF